LKLADLPSKASVEEFNTPSRGPCQHSDFDRFVVSKEMAMTRVFVLTNHKGGGKSTSATTIALGLSAVLRRAGAANPRVFLIDTDSQGHAMLITTVQKDYSVDNSLYTVLAADRQVAAQTLANCTVPPTWDADLHVLPASHPPGGSICW
jgi:hypothetical protein